MHIEAKELGKTYGEGEAAVCAVKPCTFALESGEQWAVTGPSGSGKSTLLHLLGGLDRPTRGQVLCDGRDIFSQNDSRLADFRLRHVGFVFQSYHLLPELTAYENILLPCLLKGEKADKHHLDHICDRLNLLDRLQHLPSQLSGGQQQRVAIARALANRPQILLCDEPTGNLDSQNSENVVALLKDMAAELRLTLVVVTHDRDIASQYARVLTARDGVVGGDV
ncbi:MAG: ABC transporter ATP-binding protein [Oscillospiraceae bacterium]|jgi:putative ABC transport system ATP-binding protein|nr:ABC transporter ATP-binding protein [Oscillospiraceae bacterium]